MRFSSDGECVELGIDEIWELLVNMSEEAAILAQRIRVLEKRRNCDLCASWEDQ